jgi:phosphotransferase system IIB component
VIKKLKKEITRLKFTVKDSLSGLIASH